MAALGRPRLLKQPVGQECPTDDAITSREPQSKWLLLRRTRMPVASARRQQASSFASFSYAGSEVECFAHQMSHVRMRRFEIDFQSGFPQRFRARRANRAD